MDPPPPPSIAELIAAEKSIVAGIGELIQIAKSAEDLNADTVAILEGIVTDHEKLRDDMIRRKKRLEHSFNKLSPIYNPRDPPGASILTRVVNVAAVGSLELRRAATSGITMATNGITTATNGIRFTYDKAYKVANVASTIANYAGAFFRRS